jgi:opacity protein-like surface antigen
MRIPLAALVLAASLPLAAQSGGEFKRWEAHGFIGGARSYDDEGYIGSGLSTGFGIGKRLTRRIGIEGEYTYFRHRREIAGGAFVWKGSGNLVTGNALFHFRPESNVQPFLLIGAGTLTYVNGGGAGFAWNCGAGVKAYLTSHIFIRPEVRISSGRFDRAPFQPEPPLSNLRFQFGIGYRW